MLHLAQACRPNLILLSMSHLTPYTSHLTLIYVLLRPLTYKCIMGLSGSYLLHGHIHMHNSSETERGSRSYGVTPSYSLSDLTIFVSLNTSSSPLLIAHLRNTKYYNFNTKHILYFKFTVQIQSHNFQSSSWYE